jgi:hypothetical protein
MSETQLTVLPLASVVCEVNVVPASIVLTISPPLEVIKATLESYILIAWNLSE